MLFQFPKMHPHFSVHIYNYHMLHECFNLLLANNFFMFARGREGKDRKVEGGRHASDLQVLLWLQIYNFMVHII